MSDDDSSSGWTGDDIYIGTGRWRSPSYTEHAPPLSYPQTSSELIKSYYTAYKGLSSGSNTFRGLPPELVLHICRLGGFELSYTIRAPEGRKKVYASGSQPQSLTWFRTKSFTKEMLNHTKSIQLITVSRHQGWVSDREAGSWSWFELQVARGSSHAKVKHRSDGSEISWCCLEHPVDTETARLQGSFAEHKGDIFDSDHDIWNQIEVGDVLQVTMKARFGGWSNTAADGILNINVWWEPSAKMLNLMERSSIPHHSNSQS